MDFVAYHNTDKMGRALQGGPPYVWITSKPVAHLRGNRVWGIEGRGQRTKTYLLSQLFTVDRVVKTEGDGEEFRYQYSGRTGRDFLPGVPLNGLPWFARFLKAVANFSIGVTPIKPEFLPHFEAFDRRE